MLRVGRSGPISLALGVSTSLLHGVYALTTSTSKSTTIKDTYQFDRMGMTNFMLVDESGNHYRMSNSVWYWKWDTIEDVYKNRIKDSQIDINYYGWRIPVLGIFPNIYNSKKLNN